MQRLALLAGAAALAAASLSCKKADSSDLAERVAKLEADAEKMREVQKFLAPHMAQAKKEEAQRAEREPDPNARFAVNIDGSPTHGPEGAAVTVIEAFDFA